MNGNSTYYEPSKKLISDVEHLSIEEWRQKHPYFYNWLTYNGFRYHKEFDKSLQNSHNVKEVKQK